MKPNVKKLIAILLTVAIVAGFLLWLFPKTPVAEAGWYDDSWLYRQIVTITNSGSAQTDFQTMITFDTASLYTAGKIQIDCDDIRVTDINGKLLPHWIEPGTCNTSATKIWTKISSIATTGATLYIYYGNSQAASASSATDTFVREISGVQGAWNMDEASWTNDCATNTVLDSSGNANHGKSCPNADGTQPAAGKFGNGGVFDGSNDYVSVANNSSLVLPTAETFITTFKIDNLPVSEAYLFDKYLDYHIYINSSGTLVYAHYWNGWSLNITGLTTGVWYTAAATWDGSYAKFYLNGILISEGAKSGYTDSGFDLNFGRANYGGGNSYFDGAIDEVRIYNRALSQAEISDLYGTGSDRQGYATTNYPNKVLVRKYSDSVSAGSPSGEERGPGPVAYWKFDEGYGQTANDSAFNNNGTLGVTSGTESSDPTWQSEDMCVTGKCLKFDGADDYVNVGNGASLNMTDAITVEAWINWSDGSPSWQYVLEKMSADANTRIYIYVDKITGL